MAPVRVYPEVTPLELQEKVEALEKLVTVEKEPKETSRGTEFGKKFKAIAGKTTLLIVGVAAPNANSAIYELFIGGKKSDAINLAAATSQSMTAIVPVGEEWEVTKTGAAGAGEGMTSYEWGIGGIGTRGEQGLIGKEGPKGEKGEKGEIGPAGPAGNLTAENAGGAGNILERVSEKVGKWVKPLTTFLIEEIESRKWLTIKATEFETTEFKAPEIIATKLLRATAASTAEMLGKFIIAFLQLKEISGEITTAAGEQELEIIAAREQTNIQLLVPAATTTELTGIKNSLEKGTILIFNVRVTAGRVLVFQHRKAGVEEAKWFNLPKGENIKIESATVLPKILVFQKWTQGWQLISQTG